MIGIGIRGRLLPLFAIVFTWLSCSSPIGRVRPTSPGGTVSAVVSVEEARALPGSSIGEIAAHARRSGQEWFVGVINGGDEREFSVTPDFLDSPATAFTLTETTVRPGQPIPTTLRHGGGFAAWVKPAEAKQ